MLKKDIKIERGAALLLSLLITSVVSLIGYRLFDITIFTSELEKKYLSDQQSLLLVLSLEEYTLDFISSSEKRKEYVFRKDLSSWTSPGFLDTTGQVWTATGQVLPVPKT